jgi:biopolymer transport protein ExbB/TolQ
MAADKDPYKLSAPYIFLVRMILFLVLGGFVVLILHRQIMVAFMANPGLNSLILGVLFIGVVLSLRQVARLFPEIRWVNAQQLGERGGARAPVLLAPVALILGEGLARRAISALTLRAVLDSIGTRLDESREIARYLTGLLVFLGLLGTFWGLLETVASIGGVIKSMQAGADAAVMFDDLKNGLAAPIAGMAVSFTSSLFGLAGSLVLGFLDLQAGQAQNRFFTELEDYLSFNVSEVVKEAAQGSERAAADPANARAATAALANLAEGVQGLVRHMRVEQQQIRDWVETHAATQRELKETLDKLISQMEKR